MGKTSGWPSVHSVLFSLRLAAVFFILLFILIGWHSRASLSRPLSKIRHRDTYDPSRDESDGASVSERGRRQTGGTVICPRQQIYLVSGGKQEQIKSDIERRFILIELRFKMFSEAYSAALHTDLRC